jgi:hypothetical protein
MSQRRGIDERSQPETDPGDDRFGHRLEEPVSTRAVVDTPVQEANHKGAIT